MPFQLIEICAFFLFSGSCAVYLTGNVLSQEKLLASKNRNECSVGKKLHNDMLPEIEKVHKVFFCDLVLIIMFEVIVIKVDFF